MPIVNVMQEHELQNAYIGEYQEGWQPWANTIAYYKFDGNLNDDSWNSHDMSLYTWSVTYWTASWWWKYAHFNQNTWTNYWTYSWFNYDWEYTISFRFNPQTIFSSGWPHDIVELREDSTYAYLRIVNSIYINYWLSPDYSTPLSSNTWYNIIYTRNWNSAELFINWVLIISWTPSFSWRTNQTMRFRVNQVPDTNSSSYANNWYYSEIIWENKARTAQEKLNYYNQTKSLYGIS